MNGGHRLRDGDSLGAGRYVIEAVLGQGGFGVTYRATDTQLHRPVAIKEFFLAGSSRIDGVVQPPPGLEEEFESRKDRIRDEARALARFRHPGIVTVHEYLEEHGTIYVVMELLAGRTLRQVLAAAGGPLPEHQAVRYTAEVAAALDAVHAQNLLHRDIKPDNLMVLDDGQVVLVDFGTAREFAEGRSSLMSQTLTPGYAPVEQYTAHGRFGPPTDVYALGATAYHMLTGVAPMPSLDRYTGGADLVPPRALNPSVSQAASDAVVWAMALAGNDRPQTAGEFATALQGGASPPPPDRGGTTRIVTPGATTPPPPVVAPPHREPSVGPPGGTPPGVTPPRRRRRRAVRRGVRRMGRLATNLALTVIIGIGATFAVTWFLDRTDDGPDPGTTAPPPTGGPTSTLGEEGSTTTTLGEVPPPPPPGVMQLDVVDVAADDVLNVRAGPGTEFDPPIFELPPDATDVPATGNVATIGPSAWAEVATPGGNGWASLNFLDSREPGAELALTESLRASVAGVLLDEPGQYVVLADFDARRGPGPRFEPAVALPVGEVVEVTGDLALVDGELWAQIGRPGGPPAWLPADLLDVGSGPGFLGRPPGLLCADLAAEGFDYAMAYAYWEWDGRPDRMDSDTNGIPCETIYPAAEVAFHLSVRGG